MSEQLPGQITVDEYLRSISEPEDFSKYMNKPELDPVREYALIGSAFQGGNKRIVKFFLENRSEKARAEFLKNEYGVGGFGFTGSKENTITGGSYNSKGNVIDYIDESGERKRIELSWTQLSDAIWDLIERGEYK